MNTVVMKLGEKDLKNLKQSLKHYKTNNNNPYVTFAAKVSGVTILIYTSGKVVFQGVKAQTIAEQFGYNPILDSQDNNQNIPIIGTDEVGNGSYFGGIVVVASFVTPNHHKLLNELGVDDSKKLTDHAISQIAPVLKQHIKHKSLLLSPKKYNQLVGKDKNYNAVSVKVALHNQAIYLLLKEGITPKKIVIDAFTSQQNYQHYLKNETNQFTNPITLTEKAEGKYLAVAVSSIIARDLFLKNLAKLSQEIHCKLPSGAGSLSDKVASQILENYGLSGLENVAKLHFANTQKAQALVKNKK